MVLGAISCGVMVLPRNSTLVFPKWHLSIDSLSPACLMHSKTARRLRISCVSELAAIPMSSTYCAHRSALITLSKYSRMKLENADRALLNPSQHRTVPVTSFVFMVITIAFTVVVCWGNSELYR